jgi:hypothetical protein
MHIIERLALSAGVKIGKPRIYQEFFPLATAKYITLHTTTKQSKSYDYFPEVIELLGPILKKHGIDIVQIGDKENKVINGIYNTCGQTTLNQTAYVLAGSLLHLGVDSFPVHISSGIDPEKKIVALYSNNYVNCVLPFWTQPENRILLEPKRAEGEKPSFAFEENPKSINTISPELIARSVCELLGLDFPFTHETIHIGKKIRERHLEIIPSRAISVSGETPIVIRMDKEFNEENLAKQLRENKCYVITDKPIREEILKTFKSQIMVQYEILEDNSPEFVENLIRLGVPYSLVSHLSTEKINKIKSNYIDLGVIEGRVPEKIDFEDVSRLRYRSAKIITKNAEKYYSHQGVENNEKIEKEGEFHPVKDTELFWRDSEYYHIIQQN